MKKLLLILVSTLFSITAFAQEVIKLSEPVQQTDAFEVFGEEIDVESLSPVLLSEAVDQNMQEVAVVTEVTEVCQKKGCFFIARDGELTARVTFKDYGFFIPTNSGGKEVILKGVLTQKVISEEQAKHFAEDAGKNPDLIRGEQREYSIVANSVIIPKS